MSDIQRKMLFAYTIGELYEIKPYDYKNYFNLKAVDSYLQNSDNPYIKHFKNSCYQLYNYEKTLNNTKFYVDHRYLITHGKLIKDFYIFYNDRELAHEGDYKVRIQTIKLKDEYYLNAFSSNSSFNREMYILSSYSGILKLSEQSQKHFISELLIKLLKKRKRGGVK